MSEPQIKQILKNAKTIAVVGFSVQPSKPSFYVSKYMHDAGYTVLPVNPTVAGQPSGRTLPVFASVAQAKAAAGCDIDIVNVFRRSEQVGPAVSEAIDNQARVVWMQQGIVNDAEAVRARAAGLEVVMDRCIKVDHRIVCAQGTQGD